MSRHWGRGPRVRQWDKPSKYRARMVKLDTYTFHSQAEAAYYQHLKLAWNVGDITFLKVHPRYELLPKPNKIVYVSDFEVTWKDGRTEVIEVKGYETEGWRLKKKLFQAKYPELNLRIVKA